MKSICRKVVDVVVLFTFVFFQIFPLPLYGTEVQVVQDPIQGFIPAQPFQSNANQINSESNPLAGTPDAQVSTIDFLNQSSENPLSASTAENSTAEVNSPAPDRWSAVGGVEVVEDNGVIKIHFPQGVSGGTSATAKWHLDSLPTMGSTTDVIEIEFNATLYDPTQSAEIQIIGYDFNNSQATPVRTTVAPYDVVSGRQTIQVFVIGGLDNLTDLSFKVYEGNNLESIDILSVVPFSQPPVPEGWTRAASNANYALRMTKQAEPQWPSVEFDVLQVIDLRTQQVTNVANFGIGDNPPIWKYDVSPDDVPGGAVVFYEFGIPDNIIIARRLSNPDQYTFMSDRFVQSEPTLRSIEFNSQGQAIVKTLNSYQDGTQLEHAYTLNLDSLTVIGSSTKLINQGNLFAIDSGYGIHIASNQESGHSTIFDMKQGPDQMETVVWFDFVLDPEVDRIFSVKIYELRDDPGLDPHFEDLRLSISLANDDGSIRKTIVRDVANNNIVFDGWSIESVRYVRNIAIYQLKNAGNEIKWTAVDLTSLQEVPLPVPEGWTRVPSLSHLAYQKNGDSTLIMDLLTGALSDKPTSQNTDNMPELYRYGFQYEMTPEGLREIYWIRHQDNYSYIGIYDPVSTTWFGEYLANAYNPNKVSISPDGKYFALVHNYDHLTVGTLYGTPWSQTLEFPEAISPSDMKAYFLNNTQVIVNLQDASGRSFYVNITENGTLEMIPILPPLPPGNWRVFESNPNFAYSIGKPYGCYNCLEEKLVVLDRLTGIQRTIESWNTMSQTKYVSVHAITSSESKGGPIILYSVYEGTSNSSFVLRRLDDSDQSLVLNGFGPTVTVHDNNTATITFLSHFYAVPRSVKVDLETFRILQWIPPDGWTKMPGNPELAYFVWEKTYDDRVELALLMMDLTNGTDREVVVLSKNKKESFGDIQFIPDSDVMRYSVIKNGKVTTSHLVSLTNPDLRAAIQGPISEVHYYPDTKEIVVHAQGYKKSKLSSESFYQYYLNENGFYKAMFMSTSYRHNGKIQTQNTIYYHLNGNVRQSISTSYDARGVAYQIVTRTYSENRRLIQIRVDRYHKKKGWYRSR